MIESQGWTALCYVMLVSWHVNEQTCVWWCYEAKQASSCFCLFLLQRSTLHVQTNVSLQAEAPSLPRGFNAAQNNRVGLDKFKQAGAVLQLQQAESLLAAWWTHFNKGWNSSRLCSFLTGCSCKTDKTERDNNSIMGNTNQNKMRFHKPDLDWSNYHSDNNI